MVTESKASSLKPLDHESPSKIELKVVGAYPHHEEVKEVEEKSIDGENSVPEKKKKKRIRLRDGVKIPKYEEITWVQVWHWTKEFMKDPLNLAFVIWMVISTFFFVFIGLSEIGALNSAFDDDEKRIEWTDIATQIMNALFVLMNLAFHPLFFHHTLYLWRWRQRDQLKLRLYYCRGGFQKPNDWWHILCVVIQLHIMCFSMYALALVYWIYPHGHRPTAAVWITLVIATISPVTAFLYYVMSPLQKDYHEVVAATSAGPDVPVVFHERNMVFALNGVVVENPEWQGSVCSDCFSKKRTAILTFLLPYVVFGIHMQRLNLGNKFIQGATFLLVVLGPLLLFELAAQTVKERETRMLVAGMGLAVAELSFVYGAIWRTRMRKKYHLPASRWCCGNASMTDCAVWLLCPFCALCQEARTSQHYQIVEKTQDGIFVDPDDLADGGAEMEDSNLQSSTEFDFHRSNGNPMVPPEVMHDPIRGPSNKSGFTRLDNSSY